jgi:membrane complex biogenesis BtpA family protein
MDNIFDNPKPIIGVVHLLPLPGSPRWDGQIESICSRAEQEALALTTGGVDGIIIENFFDAPFAKNHLDPAAVCVFTLAVKRVMALCDLPIGINCLRNDGLSALAIAFATGAQFIRVNVYLGAMLTDQGIIEGNGRELLLYRKSLQAQKTIKIFADVLVKHAYPMANNVDLVLSAEEIIERGLADALIVTGTKTGSSPELSDLKKIRAALPKCSLIAGSGCSKDNITQLLDIADGVIVASSLKQEGLIEQPIDVEKVRTLVQAATNSP